MREQKKKCEKQFQSVYGMYKDEAIEPVGAFLRHYSARYNYKAPLHG